MPTQQSGTGGLEAEAGPARAGWSRVMVVTGVVTVALLTAAASVGLLLLHRADGSLTRVPVEGLTDGDSQADGELADAAEDSNARHFLVVGSDVRSEDEEVASDEVDGHRADAVLLVTLSKDRSSMSVVSLPRDLRVELDGEHTRLSDTFMDGPGTLVTAVSENYALPVNHYVEMTFGGFVDAVRTLGGVEMCLQDDLEDADAGADLQAGCQHLDADDALAFVRSREGDRADLERVDRQQRFLRATIDRLTERRVLADVPRLFTLVEDLAGNVTTDEELGLGQMLGLADETRGMVDGDVPMTTVPSYVRTLENGRDVLVPYAPGAKALFDEVQTGREVTDRGTYDERADTSVALWSGGRGQATEIIDSTLLFGGFGDTLHGGPGEEAIDGGATTAVHAADDDQEAGERVAALLGAPLRGLPEGIEVPDGADVVVAVGDDATEEFRPVGDQVQAGPSRPTD